MRRKVLVGGLAGVALVMVIGVGTVFAQQATLDKITKGQYNNTVKAAHKDIRGEVVISGKNPSTSSTMSAIDRSGFDGCSHITSVILGDQVSSIGDFAFANCTRLTSVTFGSSGRNFSVNAFPGNLRDVYKDGGSGTYSRDHGSNVWYKDGGRRGGGGGGGVAVGGPSGGGGGVAVSVGVSGPGQNRGGPPPRGRQFCQCCGQPLP